MEHTLKLSITVPRPLAGRARSYPSIPMVQAGQRLPIIDTVNDTLHLQSLTASGDGWHDMLRCSLKDDTTSIRFIVKIVTGHNRKKAREYLACEAQNYHKLDKLQGDIIPRFYGHFQNGRVACILLEDCGQPFAIDDDGEIQALPAEKQEIANLLMRLHKAGYTHEVFSPTCNVVKLENKLRIVGLRNVKPHTCSADKETLTRKPLNDRTANYCDELVEVCDAMKLYFREYTYEGKRYDATVWPDSKLLDELFPSLMHWSEFRDVLALHRYLYRAYCSLLVGTIKSEEDDLKREVEQQPVTIHFDGLKASVGYFPPQDKVDDLLGNCKPSEAYLQPTLVQLEYVARIWRKTQNWAKAKSWWDEEAKPWLQEVMKDSDDEEDSV